MNRLLPAGIARRYMRSRRSHSAVRAISAVAVCGVAIATAAIICVLSVFNGFRSIMGERLDRLTPDVTVSPAKGKMFANADSLAAVIGRVEGVARAVPTLTDNALALYEGREMPVTLKGVDFDTWRQTTAIDSLIIDGGGVPSSSSALDSYDGLTQALFSIGTASQLGINSARARVLLFSPRREGRVNLANPAASFITDSVAVAGIFEAEQSDYDANTVVAPLPMVRDLFQYYDREGSAVEVTGKPGFSPEKLAEAVEKTLGPESGVIVKDRAAMQEVNFRMVQIEKWVTFLLLFFILVIASFNIISSLCMAVIEKDRSMATLRALGMTRREIGAIFGWESMYVTLAGGLGGLILGVGLCLLQQHYGLIRLQGDPGDLVVKAYPVEVIPSDIWLTIAPVLLIGIITSRIAAGFARQRINSL
ncbi:MAG: ABC transporter permease [Bacteroides sp.]|nr:ABC transporter permease [Bacteroides sp.]